MQNTPTPVTPSAILGEAAQVAAQVVAPLLAELTQLRLQNRALEERNTYLESLQQSSTEG